LKQLLDHGYLKYIDHMGTDQSIVEAARMSTDKGFLGWGDTHHTDNCPGYPGERLTKACDASDGCGRLPGDEKLLQYLYRNKHATPFEMVQLKIEVKAPIFLFREWHRHRTQSYNEMSSRYIQMPDENYIPSMERLMIEVSTTNKQAGTVAGAPMLEADHAESFRCALAATYADAERLYQTALKSGVPKELARLCIPVARYSKMQASANLRNWLAFLTLRMDPAAQWEIRQYANAVGEIIAEKFPRTWELFEEGRKK
jgi:thymidylate synthase (FAD)